MAVEMTLSGVLKYLGCRTKSMSYIRQPIDTRYTHCLVDEWGMSDFVQERLFNETRAHREVS